jgi:hypothetical protein
MFGWMGVTDA